MVQFTRLFVSLCLIAASVSSPTKRTVAQVEADIASISTQLTTLDEEIKDFTAPDPLGALSIQMTTGSLEHTLNTATLHVKETGPIGEADAPTILDSVEAIEPIIIDALTQIAGKKANFAALLVAPPVVLADLETLKTDTDELGAALISVAPTDLKPSATSIMSAIDAAFATAIAAYS
ncbi:Hydrophobic surface binding protein [Mycena sanguinolenta]|uniref:Hydrophobic surface binding protein n=1 Tax=Mycena sanguinolenta TaxID=230812 RepID=A0A8H7CT23_9AGAR|nr:Hydrophobic surface binding protein [Mycena sanguinolenta]